jgi:hypothetical protein
VQVTVDRWKRRQRNRSLGWRERERERERERQWERGTAEERETTGQLVSGRERERERNISPNLYIL